MRKILVLLTTMLVAAHAHAEFKIGYVDVHEAVEKSAVGKKAKEEMKKESEKRQKELDKKKADLDKMNEDIEKKKTLLSEEALQKRSQELQTEVQKFLFCY